MKFRISPPPENCFLNTIYLFWFQGFLSSFFPSFLVSLYLAVLMPCILNQLWLIIASNILLFKGIRFLALKTDFGSSVEMNLQVLVGVPILCCKIALKSRKYFYFQPPIKITELSKFKSKIEVLSLIGIENLRSSLFKDTIFKKRRIHFL